MAQFVNAHIPDNERKMLRIESLVLANREQSDVLQQHQIGQQVLAEMIKKIIVGQHSPQQCQQQQGIAGTGPIVTDATRTTEGSGFSGRSQSKSNTTGYRVVLDGESMGAFQFRNLCFVTILRFWFSTVLDFLPPRPSYYSIVFHVVPCTS